MGGESGGAAREKGLERLGGLCCYGVFAGGVVGDGDLFRGHGSAKEERSGD